MRAWIRNYRKDGQWKSNDLIEFDNESELQDFIAINDGIQKELNPEEKGILRLFSLDGNRELAIL